MKTSSAVKFSRKLSRLQRGLRYTKRTRQSTLTQINYSSLPQTWTHRAMLRSLHSLWRVRTTWWTSRCKTLHRVKLFLIKQRGMLPS